MCVAAVWHFPAPFLLAASSAMGAFGAWDLPALLCRSDMGFHIAFNADCSLIPTLGKRWKMYHPTSHTKLFAEALLWESESDINFFSASRRANGCTCLIRRGTEGVTTIAFANKRLPTQQLPHRNSHNICREARPRS